MRTLSLPLEFLSVHLSQHIYFRPDSHLASALPIAAMGRRNWRGGYRDQNNEVTWQDRFQAPAKPFDRYPPRAPQGPAAKDNSKVLNPNPFLRNQYPQYVPWSTGYHQINDCQVPRRFDHTFVTKSKILREYLVQSLSQALVQVHQWYPEDPSEDEMDWQHEQEIVVPQHQDVCYAWGDPQHECQSLESSYSGRLSAPKVVNGGMSEGAGLWASLGTECRRVDDLRKERCSMPELVSPTTAGHGNM